MTPKALQTPIFPLPIGVLPGEEKGLHIFEPRYKLLIREALASHTLFGIPYKKDGQMGSFGTQVRVSRVLKKYDDERMDIMVEGVGTFVLEGVLASPTADVYGTGMIVLNESDMLPVSHETFDAFFSSYIEVTGRVLDPDDYADADIFKLAVKLPLNEEQKVGLISAQTLAAREVKLRAFLRFLALIRKQEEKVKGAMFPN